MHRRMSALLVVLSLAMAVIAEGQERFGALTGRVTDQQNMAIPGVTVVTTNTESGQVRTFVTDAEGRFTAPDLVPGRYTVRFELTGFSKVERPDVSVVAVDASADAIALAQANVDELVPGRVELFVSDLYAAVPPGRMFDVVAGNLPYVADDDPGLESQVAKHEPALALYGGPDGLDIIRRAAAEVPTWLKPGGTMVIECGGAQEDLIGDVMLGAGLIEVRTARDLAGIERVVYARLPADA